MSNCGSGMGGAGMSSQDAEYDYRYIRLSLRRFDGLAPETRSDILRALAELDALDRKVFAAVRRGATLYQIGLMVSAHRQRRSADPAKTGDNALRGLASRILRVLSRPPAAREG